MKQLNSLLKSEMQRDKTITRREESSCTRTWEQSPRLQSELRRARTSELVGELESWEQSPCLRSELGKASAAGPVGKLKLRGKHDHKKRGTISTAIQQYRLCRLMQFKTCLENQCENFKNKTISRFLTIYILSFQGHIIMRIAILNME